MSQVYRQDKAQLYHEIDKCTVLALNHHLQNSPFENKCEEKIDEFFTR